MKEEWVEIEGYPTYAISNKGRVVNLQRDTLLKSRPNVDGYLRVTLSNEGDVADFYVHRLVAAAFFADYDPRGQVIHWDTDKENNAVTNLRMKRREVVRQLPRRPEIGRRVVVVETGDVFRTARECADVIGGDYGSVYAVLRGARRSHMGYTFKYHDEYESEAA